MRATALALLIFLALVPTAAADHVACGEVLTADTTLDSDLHCTSEAGLIVGADGIAIDLAGHQVSSSIRPALDNQGGYDDVTVANGSLSGASAVTLVGADRNTFDGVRMRGEAAAYISGSDDVRIQHGYLGGALSGVDIVDSDRTVLDGMEIFSLTSGSAVRVGAGSDDTVLTGLVFPSSSPSACCLSGRGIQVEGDTVGTTIDGNTIAGQPFGGIFVEEGALDVTITHNTANGSVDGSGIHVLTPSASVGWNSTNDNGRYGIYAPGATDLGGNQATGNGCCFPDEPPFSRPQCVGVVCNAAQNVFSGFLAPIAGDGSSSFRQGKPVRVRFRVTDAAGNPAAGAAPSLSVAEVVGGVTGSYGPATSVNSKGFRYDKSSGRWSFLLKTRVLTAGVWSLRVTLADGSSHDVRLTLR